MKKELRDKLIEAIDLDGYGDKYAPTIEGLKEIMIKEFFCPYEMQRAKGRLSILASNWFRGLPSAVDIPFYYEDTNTLMVECGYEVEGMDYQEVDNLYWKELGEILVEG